jgi:hypothetical protein
VLDQREEGPKLKEPNMFTSKNPEKLNPFITQCCHWFLTWPQRYAANQDKVLFAASYLRELANLWWMPLLSAVPPPPILDNWELFMDELFNKFDNKHLRSTSQNTIIHLKMKEDTRVTEYLVTFGSHAHYMGWDDAALPSHFYHGLPN